MVSLHVPHECHHFIELGICSHGCMAATSPSLLISSVRTNPLALKLQSQQKCEVLSWPHHHHMGSSDSMLEWIHLLLDVDLRKQRRRILQYLLPCILWLFLQHVPMRHLRALWPNADLWYLGRNTLRLSLFLCIYGGDYAHPCLFLHFDANENKLDWN